jgi:MFS transporter, OFA family, oxalate/formate antiporter
LANINSARKFYGWNNAALLFLIQFGASGFVYFAYSAVFPAMVEAMDWNRGSASIAHSLGFLMLGLCYPLTAFLIGKIGVRMTLTAGLIVMLTGLLMVIFLVTEIWQWIVVWGLVVGLSFSLTGPICGQTLVIHWFNIRRATVLGIFATGSAVGGFFAQPILTSLMEYYGSWQSGWMVSAAVIVLAIILTQFLINRPADIGQFPDNVDPNLTAHGDHLATKPRTHRSAHNWALSEVFTNPTIYYMMIIAVTYLGIGTFIITHGALHLQDIGISKLETASLMGIFILGSGAGRIPAGMLGDRIELRWLVAAIMGVFWVSFTLFSLTEDYILLAVTGFIAGACYGGKFAIAPAMMSNYFGEESFAKINSTFAPILLPFVAIAPAGAGFIFEAQGSYDLAFLIGSVLLGISFVASMLAKPPLRRSLATA